MNRIREIRKAKKLTLQKVADLADTTVQQVQRLERGDRKLTIEWMERLAKALNCKPAELLPESFGNEQTENDPIYLFDKLIGTVKDPFVIDMLKTLKKKEMEE